MQKILTHFFTVVSILFVFLSQPIKSSAAVQSDDYGFIQTTAGSIGLAITGCESNCPEETSKEAPLNLAKYMAGGQNEEGKMNGLLPLTGKVMALLYERQPGTTEYFADIAGSIGLPQVSPAYAQGTGYSAMSSFLPMWKVFRNLAYSIYILMFIVIGIMIMFRTKVGGQTIVTIQSAIPNLLITLILITFSYAIVGFMIDLMYFLIYFTVFLVYSAGLLNDPNKLITRLMTYSAWSVVFEGRNSIVSAVALSIGEALSGLGTGLLEVAGTAISAFATPAYVVVAITMAIAMLKLMYTLVRSYVMLIVQTITAPVQIMMNAIPGSKSFGQWLKTTASYLIPFPVVGAMFVLSAIFIGNPTKAVIFDGEWAGDANPFNINEDHPFYTDYYSNTNFWTKGDDSGTIWLPPFTLTGSVDIVGPDIMRIIGFVILIMTPAAAKMAQDWLQVKESPYASEAFSTAQLGYNIGVQGPMNLGKSIWHKAEQRELMQQQASWIREGVQGQKTPKAS